MTDLSKKNRIIALTSYSFTSLILTVRSALPFTFILFFTFGIFLFFAEKILNSEKIKERTFFAFCVFSSCYQTFYQNFYREYLDINRIMSAIAMFLFLVAVFAATDEKKHIVSLVCTPVICILDSKLGIAYCLMIFSFETVKFHSNCLTNGKRQKSTSKKKSESRNKYLINPLMVNISSIVISIICFTLTLLYLLRNHTIIFENFDYFLRTYKNTFGFCMLIAYLLVKLIKSNFNVKIKINVIVGFIFNLIFMVFYTYNWGWTCFSLYLISIIIFLGLTCLEKEEIIYSIKADYYNHKYIFIVLLLCLLQ